MSLAPDTTPFQTPPAMRSAAALVSTNEYAVVWTGQSNARPKGDAADMLSVAQDLVSGTPGGDIAAIVIPDNAAREVGMVEVLTLTLPSTALNEGEWNTDTYLRLGQQALSVPGAPKLGYAKVLANTAATLKVQWISLPTNDSTQAGYLVRDPYPGFGGADGPGGARYYAYEPVRVLTPYMPVTDIVPPRPTENAWVTPQSAAYPVVNGPLRTGRRLTLPVPWVLPAAVTTFDDLGVFLPLTRREGQHGYGISEIADASWDGTVGTPPVAHPILSRSGEVFTFANAISADVDLTSGYVIVDWESAGAAKRSWSRIASSTTTTFTTDGTWLGDGLPGVPDTATVTFDHTTERVTWTGHSFVEGDRVAFNGGTLPAGLTNGRPYVVRNVSGDTFQLSETLDHQVITITDNGAPTITGVQVWWYAAWIGHYRDNPYVWLPGPEFAMPNEDQEPHAPFVHFRARGQLNFAHQIGEPPIPQDTTLPADGTTGGRVGPLLPFAWRLAATLGKRLNVVCLATDSTPLEPSHLPNFTSHTGTVGWYDYTLLGYGIGFEDGRSYLAARLKRLITVIAVQALLAESNAKTVKYLATAHVQGESEAVLHAGREHYEALLTDYKRWLIELFDSISANPYAGDARPVFVQPLLTYVPWQTTAINPDTQGDANNAIKLAHVPDPFADIVLVDDLPKRVIGGAADLSHYGGQGAYWLGSRLAAAAAGLIDYALSHTSAALSPTNARLLRIVNRALQHIGQGARQVTDLEASTTEARLAKDMLPEAIKQMLSWRSWSWATRIERATKVHNHHPRWQQAYVVPGRAVTPTAILEPTAAETASTSPVFVSVLDQVVDPNSIRSPDVKPLGFEIVRDLSGHRILQANIDETAAEDLSAGPSDGKLHPERLPGRPFIQYVDDVRNPEDFSDSFAHALTWLLASMFAPSLIKGVEGERVSNNALQKCAAFIRVEATHESLTQHLESDFRDAHRPTWISER